jgi:hypothetical protein
MRLYLMQKATMAEGIVNVPSHLAAVGLEALQFEILPFPDFSEYMKFVAPEQIIEEYASDSFHLFITSFSILDNYIQIPLCQQ